LHPNAAAAFEAALFAALQNIGVTDLQNSVQLLGRRSSVKVVR